METKNTTGALWLILIFCLTVTVLAMCSCATKKNIENSSSSNMKNEYVGKTNTTFISDTVYRYDSVFVKVKGDTVYVEKWRNLYNTKIDWRIKRDTICRTDTITNTEYKEKVVEKVATFSKLKTFVYGLCAGLILGICIFLFLKFKFF